MPNCIPYIYICASVINFLYLFILQKFIDFIIIYFALLSISPAIISFLFYLLPQSGLDELQQLEFHRMGPVMATIFPTIGKTCLSGPDHDYLDGFVKDLLVLFQRFVQ